MASEQTTPTTGSGTQKRQRKKSHPYSEQLEKFVSVVQKKSILLSIENRRSRVSNMDVYGALWHYAGAKMPKERLQKHALSRRLAAQVRLRNTRQRREIRANLLAIATAKAAEHEPVPQVVEHEADEEDMEIDPSSHSSKSGNTVDMRSVLSLSRESSVAPMSVVEGGIRSRRNTTSSVELASVDLSDEKSASMDSASVTEPIGENNRENDVDLEAERDADATLYGIEEPETDESASDSGSSKSNSKTGETTEDIGNVTQTPDNIITTTAGTEDSPPEPTAPIPYSTKDNPDTDKTASESCMSVSSATKTASEGSELLSETTESTTETSEHTSETTGSTTETSEYTSSTTQYTSGRSTEAVYEASSRGSFGDTESQTGDDQEKHDSGSEWELTLPIDPDDGSADSSRLTPDGDLIDVVVERFKDAAIQNRKKGSPKRKACREEDEYPNDRSEDFPSPRKKRNSGTPPRPSTPCSPRSIRTPRRRSNSEPSVAGGAERSEELVFLRRSSPRVSGKRPYLKRSAPPPE